MTQAYGTTTIGIKDALLAVIRTTTTFATHAYADYIKEIPANPTALLRLREDEFEDIGPRETYHRIRFDIWVQYAGSPAEATLNSMIGYVGEIVDAIEADRTLSSAFVENTEILMTDFSFRERGPSVIHSANITVQVRALRNV